MIRPPPRSPLFPYPPLSRPTLVEADRPLWSMMSFEAAEENFITAARHGLDGPLYWPGTGWIRPDELVLRKLLDRKSTRLNSRSPCNLVCRLLLEKKKHKAPA